MGALRGILLMAWRCFLCRMIKLTDRPELKRPSWMSRLFVLCRSSLIFFFRADSFEITQVEVEGRTGRHTWSYSFIQIDSNLNHLIVMVSFCASERLYSIKYPCFQYLPWLRQNYNPFGFYPSTKIGPKSVYFPFFPSSFKHTVSLCLLPQVWLIAMQSPRATTRASIGWLLKQLADLDF